MKQKASTKRKFLHFKFSGENEAAHLFTRQKLPDKWEFNFSSTAISSEQAQPVNMGEK